MAVSPINSEAHWVRRDRNRQPKSPLIRRDNPAGTSPPVNPSPLRLSPWHSRKLPEEPLLNMATNWGHPLTSAEYLGAESGGLPANCGCDTVVDIAISAGNPPTHLSDSKLLGAAVYPTIQFPRLNLVSQYGSIVGYEADGAATGLVPASTHKIRVIEILRGSRSFDGLQIGIKIMH